jgi:hypothetical protein
MRQLSVLLKSAIIIIPIILSGCALLGTGEADQRWANYKDWTKINNTPITGDHTGFLGGLHEAAKGYRQVYVNEIGLETSLGNGPFKYPVGTVIVKEQFKNKDALDSGKTPGLTIMVKVADNGSASASNWAWSRGYGKEAKVDDAFCSSCHTIALQKDFVFSNAESLASFR